jgi:phosphate transport system substrate-binding protein
MTIKTFAAGLIAAAVSLPAFAADISGAGATFPYPIYAKWADTYKKETGVGLNYQSIGSGGGIKQIMAKTVAFGATDMPLKAPQLEKSGLIQFPMVLGGVVPVINVDGIKPGDITLDGPTLARIFLTEIKTWNDPAIQKLNPSAKLPAQSIVVVHRSDGSGTTFLFTDYLSKVSPTWKDKVGVSTAVEWPGGLGAKGNEGVANNVTRAKGSIGYVEYAYAKQNKMSYTKLINKDGNTVAPTADAFMAAAANADWEGTPGFGVVLTDESGPTSWPLAGATFILIHKQPAKPADVAEALKFFAWAYAKGDKMALDLDYVPMPDKIVAAIQKVWATQIKDASGKPLFTASH